MKNGWTFIYLVILAFTLITISSCKSKDVKPNEKELIIGTWTLAEVESDLNANGTIDLGEQMAIPVESNVQLTLRSGNTGSLLVENLDEKLQEFLDGEIKTINDFTWELLQNETTLLINGEDTVAFTLIDIQQNSMNLRIIINDKVVLLRLKKK